MGYAGGDRRPAVALSGSARVLVMVEQPLLVEVIRLTLNHGVRYTRKLWTGGMKKAAYPSG